MNEAIFLQIGTSGPRGKGMKRSTLGVRRSKSREAEIGQIFEHNISKTDGLILLHIATYMWSMGQGHELINFRGQEFKSQGHRSQC